jgi:hypothetical protein
LQAIVLGQERGEKKHSNSEEKNKRGCCAMHESLTLLGVVPYFLFAKQVSTRQPRRACQYKLSGIIIAFYHKLDQYKMAWQKSFVNVDSKRGAVSYRVNSHKNFPKRYLPFS